MQRSRRHLIGRGFTLVEMLVVVTIIGVLVAILIPAVGGVMKSAKNARTSTEVQQLSQAIEAYKNKLNDYPPDFTTHLAVINHITTAYPRNTRPVLAWLQPNPAPTTRNPANLDAAEALVFWLAGTKKNVRDPLAGSGEAEVYFQFDTTRLKDIDNDGWPEYYPRDGDGAPYVYFDGRLMSVLPTPNATGKLQTFAYAWAVYPAAYNATTPPPVNPTKQSADIPAANSTLAAV